MSRRTIPDLADRCARHAAVRSRGVFDLHHLKRQYSNKRFSATMTIMWTPEDKAALFALARRRGCNASDLIRLAIKQLLLTA